MFLHLKYSSSFVASAIGKHLHATAFFFFLNVNNNRSVSKKMFRPRTPFDPLHIILEICAFQCVFYAASTLSILAMDFLSAIPFNSQQIFNAASFGIGTKVGRAAIVGELCGAMAAALAFSIIEGRTRKALDYMSTVFCIHILVSSLFSGFPSSFMWWVSSVIMLTISTVMAEFLSQRTELQEINLDDFASKV
jgi:hypothetical protein